MSSHLSMNTFRPAPALAPGDAVSVIAPSSPFERDAFERGLDLLAQRYRPSLSPSLHARDGYLAGSDEARAQALNAALADPKTKAVFCARGGYGATRLLPKLDVPPRPKILVGFSDITALHAALQRHGWRSVHGPVLTQLGMAGEVEARALFECLESIAPPPVLNGTPVTPGRAKGPLIGGNLSVLTRLIGTPWMPPLDGAILFLEDVGEAPYRVDRMITHLKLAGLTERLNGVALGSFSGCGDASPNGAEVARAEFCRLGVPCVADLPAGHSLPNRPLVLGAQADIDGDRGTLTFIQGAVV